MVVSPKPFSLPEFLQLIEQLALEKANLYVMKRHDSPVFEVYAETNGVEKVVAKFPHYEMAKEFTHLVKKKKQELYPELKKKVVIAPCHSSCTHQPWVRWWIMTGPNKKLPESGFSSPSFAIGYAETQGYAVDQVSWNEYFGGVAHLKEQADLQHAWMKAVTSLMKEVTDVLKPDPPPTHYNVMQELLAKHWPPHDLLTMKFETDHASMAYRIWIQGYGMVPIVFNDYPHAKSWAAEFKMALQLKQKNNPALTPGEIAQLKKTALGQGKKIGFPSGNLIKYPAPAAPMVYVSPTPKQLKEAQWAETSHDLIEAYAEKDVLLGVDFAKLQKKVLSVEEAIVKALDKEAAKKLVATELATGKPTQHLVSGDVVVLDGVQHVITSVTDTDSVLEPVLDKEELVLGKTLAKCVIVYYDKPDPITTDSVLLPTGEHWKLPVKLVDRKLTMYAPDDPALAELYTRTMEALAKRPAEGILMVQEITYSKLWDGSTVGLDAISTNYWPSGSVASGDQGGPAT